MAEEDITVLRNRLSATDYIMEPNVGKTVKNYIQLGNGK